MAYSLRIVYPDEKKGIFSMPCTNLTHAEYFAFEYAKLHPDMECIEIFDGKDCVGLIRPPDALKADPTVHIGEYETQRDPRIQEKLDQALMVRKDMLERIRKAEQEYRGQRRTS